MNKRFLKLAFRSAAILLTSASLVLTIGNQSFGWFTHHKQNEVNVGGEVFLNYFNGGNGSAPVEGQTYEGGEEEGPYQIDNATQLYHLAWLQDMGFFNTLNDDNTWNQSYFILTDNIDMEGKVLPSIGTEDYPFIGNFNGNQKTISNFKVTNSTIKTDYTSNPTIYNTSLHDNVGEIVGVFGVVGTIDGATANGSTSTLGGYTYDTSINEVKDFIIRSCVVETKTTNALVGIAVGYLNGFLSGVGVVDCDINLGSTGSLKQKYGKLSDNFSDFSLVGYSTRKAEYHDSTTLKGYSKESEVTRISTDAPGTAWGASIDMRKIYNRVTDINENHVSTDKSQYTYPTSETFTKQTDGTFKLTASTTNTMANWDDHSADRSRWRFYQGEDAGNYFFANATTEWNYLYGGSFNGGQTLTVNKIDPTRTDVNGYYILATDSESTNYGLAITGTNTLSTVEVANKFAYPSSLTVFAQDSSGHIYGINQNNQTYYLNINTSGGLTLGNSGSTVWTVTDEGGSGDYHSYRFTSAQYYLTYEGGSIVAKASYGYIGNAATNQYLKLNGTSGTNFATVSGTSTATQFYMTPTSGGKFRLYGVYNGSNVYLYDYNSNGSLRLTTSTSSASEFTSDGDAVYINANKYIIVNSSNAFALGKKEETTSMTLNTPLYLHNGNSYITNNGTSGVKTVTLTDNPCKWTITQSGSYYRFSTSISGTTYYMGIYSTSSGGIELVNKTNSYTDFSYDTDLGIFYWKSSMSDHFPFSLSGGSWSLVDAYNWSRVEALSTPFQDLGSTTQNTLGNYNVISSSIYGYGANATVIDSEAQPAGFTTCFPLTTEESYPYNVAEHNTGYITSGSFAGRSGSGSGDIRISRYYKSDLTASLRNGQITTVYTVDGNGKHVVDSTKFNKYNASKELFQKTLDSESSRVFGLHFMDAQIDKNHLTRLPKATILNNTYTNYQFPMDSVDVNIAQRGFINFFAGTYYPGNESFFSVHQIFRDQYGEIEDIKEIDSVYAMKKTDGSIDTTKPFVSVFSDGSLTPGNSKIPDGYGIVFSSHWIKTQVNITTDALYYFEVPVNTGEYALGSVPGVDGAYLCYLDLSCSQQWADSVTTTTKDSKCIDTYQYVSGVEFLCDREIDNASSYDDMFNQNNGAQFQITNGKETGNISFDKNYVGEEEQNKSPKILRATKFDSIPSEYNRLEYIESIDRQYIDTGVANTKDIAIEAKFETVGNATNNYLFGDQQNSSNVAGNGLYFGSSSNGGLIFEYNHAEVSRNASFPSGVIELTQSISGSTLNYSINGVAGSTTAATSDGTGNIYIFARKLSDGKQIRPYSGHLRCYGFKITKGTTVVRDFVPAQNSLGQSGLYDIVGKKFYTSPIGNFVPIGLPSGYTLLDSIASSSSSLSTAYTPSTKATINAEFQITTARSSKYLFGANVSSSRVYNGIKTGSSTSNTQITANIGRSDGGSAIAYNTSSKIVIEETLNGNNIDYNLVSNTTCQTGSKSVSSGSTSNPMHICGAYHSTGFFSTDYSYGTGVKCFSFKITDNGALAVDMVPCKNASGTAGFYDLVRKTFYSYGTAGNTVTNTAVHAHTYSSSWTSNATHHWHAAICGHDDKGDLAEHTWSEWTVTKAPTYETTGIEERYCTVCGYTVSNTIDKLPHHYSSTWSNDATNHWHACTDAGYETLKGDNAAHSYGDWTTITPATFETEGLEQRSCTVCGYTETRTIPATSHHFSSSWSTNESTHWHACTDSGYEYLKADENEHTFVGDVCSVCGYERDHVHTFETEWTWNDFAHWHESTCGHDVTDQNEAHSFDKNGNCTVCGYHTDRPIRFGDYEIIVTSGDDVNATMVGNNVRINEGMTTVPYKREYQDEFSIVRTDTSNTGTVMTGTVLIVDSNSLYSDGREETIRDIECKVTMKYPDSSEVTLLEFDIKGLQSLVDFNYSYVYNSATNEYYFTILTSANVTMHITTVATNGYTIYIMGQSDYVAINQPQNMTIFASGSFNPIIVPDE